MNPAIGFDPCLLALRPLAQRNHELFWQACCSLTRPNPLLASPELPALVRAIQASRRDGRLVALCLGAHPIKLGLQRYLMDLVERRLVTHVATNGAGLIHDYE